MKTHSEIFIEDFENHVKTLGQEYLDTVLPNEKLRKSVFILSDKRLYQRGVLYEALDGANFTKKMGFKVIDLNVVSSISVTKSKSTPKQVLAILFSILGAGALGSMIYGHRGYYSPAADVISVILIVLAIGAWFAYMFSKRTLLEISTEGMKIAGDIGKYNMEEVVAFQKSISVTKEKLKQKSAIDFKSCPYCDERIKIKAKICRYCHKDI
jgi:hypothetical protein